MRAMEKQINGRFIPAACFRPRIVDVRWWAVVTSGCSGLQLVCVSFRQLAPELQKGSLRSSRNMGYTSATLSWSRPGHGNGAVLFFIKPRSFLLIGPVASTERG